MAIFQPSGQILSSISGSIAGNTYFRNTAGACIRNRTIPINPQTEIQQANRDHMTQVSQYWRTLTNEEREAWDTAAASGDWPFINKVGQTFNPTGIMLFLKLNLSAYDFSFPMVEPPLQPSLTAPTPTVLFADVTPNVTINFTPDTIESDEEMLFFATPRTSTGIIRPRQTIYRLIGSLDSGGFNEADDLTEMYTDAFGSLGPGSRIFVKSVLLHKPSGVRLVAGQLTTIVLDI